MEDCGWTWDQINNMAADRQRSSVRALSTDQYQLRGLDKLHNKSI